MWTRSLTGTMRIPTAWHIVAMLRRRARAAAARRITDCLIERFVTLLSGPLAILVMLAVIVGLAFISAPIYWR